ncbi:MAG: alpha/beta hydrolase [Mycobacteriaceae bacterium]
MSEFVPATSRNEGSEQPGENRLSLLEAVQSLPIVDFPQTKMGRRVESFFSHVIRPVANQAKVKGWQLKLIRRLVDAISGPVRQGVGSAQKFLGGVPTLMLTPHGAEAGGGVILYLHGGGYVFGSPKSHRGLVSALARYAGIPAAVIDYRLAPENPFPAAIDDAFAAYCALLDSGIPANRIVIAGDSAGGHLAASLLATIDVRDKPQPAAAFLLSPVVDWSCSPMMTIDNAERDPFLAPVYAQKCTQAYIAQTPLSHPQIDILAADKSQWPPILLQVGGTEALRADAYLFSRSFPDGNSDCRIEVWPGQVHVFQSFGFLPEGRAALKKAAEFIRNELAHKHL